MCFFWSEGKAAVCPQIEFELLGMITWHAWEWSYILIILALYFGLTHYSDVPLTRLKLKEAVPYDLLVK